MKSLSVAILLACSAVLLEWADAFPIGAAHQNLRGDVSSEPNVVMQSVVVGKKPRLEIDDCDCCPGWQRNNVNIMLRRLFHIIHPHSFRYKRDGNMQDSETFDEKTLERLIEAMEELKRGSEKRKNIQAEDTRDYEVESQRGRLEHRRRRDDKMHVLGDEEDEDSHGLLRCRENYRRKLKDDEEEFQKFKNDQEKRWRKENYKKKDWQEDEERRNRQHDLADSWPRGTEEGRMDDLYLPLHYRRLPPHHRLAGDYLK